MFPAFLVPINPCSKGSVIHLVMTLVPSYRKNQTPLTSLPSDSENRHENLIGRLSDSLFTLQSRSQILSTVPYIPATEVFFRGATILLIRPLAQSP